MDAVTKVWVGYVRGKRTDAVAAAMVAQVAERLIDPTAPLYTSDEHPAYLKALQTVAVTENKGEDDAILYAVVNKTRKQGRVIEIKTEVALGTDAEVATRVTESPASFHINTSFVERFNLSARQENRRVQRKTLGFSKDGEMLDAQLHFFQACYNFVRPHIGLRLEAPSPTRKRRWIERTPAMVVGLTDAIWSLGRLLGHWPVRRAAPS